MSLDDHAEISFVEVVVHFFEAGTKTWKDQFLNGELELFGLEVDNYGEDIKEIVEGKIQNRKNEEEAERSGKNWWTQVVSDWEQDFIITNSFTAFQFCYFGQNFDDSHPSGLEYEKYNMGDDYVFEGWKDELEKIARNLQEKYKVRQLRNDWDGKAVRFVTLWSYHSWQDSYHHEWDSEWELLGLVTPSKKLLEVV